MDFSFEMVNNFTEETKVSGNFMVKKKYLFLLPPAQLVKNPQNAGDPGSISVGKIPWRRDRVVFWPGEFTGCKESDMTTL